MASGNERWKDEETALDRVWSVGVTLSRLKSPRWIAEGAEASQRKARRHLTRLVEIGTLENRRSSLDSIISTFDSVRFGTSSGQINCSSH